MNPANATGACQVTTALDDNSAGSLRSQVATCGKGGTITFASGLTRVVVSQEHDIQFTQNLTIDGGSGVTIDANHLSRIFFMFGGTVTLKNLTLQNGSAKGGNGGNSESGAGGGGAAGMGGAMFVDGGTLTIGNVIFTNNQALGGVGGAPSGGVGPVPGGGGVGGDGSATPNDIGNGGGGGDFGSSGGSGGDGSGGNFGGNGGFGGGGGGTGSGGFGGGGGGGEASGSGAGNGGSFGGVGGNLQLSGGGGGGGAGLGGAIFARNGVLVLDSVTFSANFAIKGVNGGYGTDGQGKGGALFIMLSATAVYFGSAPMFSGDSATDAGMNTACNTVVGANALDTNEVCGILTQASIAATSGGGQSTPVGAAFTHPLVATVTPAVSGIPIVFTGPTSGASTNPANNPAMTNGSGVASAMVTANATEGGPYTVTATIGGLATSATYALTNTTLPTTTTAVNVSAYFSASNQNVTLSATVTSAGGTVNTGTVTFTVTHGGTTIGSAVTSGTVTSGMASATFSVPGNTVMGAYTITAVYNAGGNFASSSDNTHALTIGGVPTTITAGNASASSSTINKTVTLTATVTSAQGTVNVGTVTFTVKQGATTIGSPVTSATVAAGAASAVFVQPANTAVGVYTISAVYNAGGNFATSSDNTHTYSVTSDRQPRAIPVSPSAIFSGSNRNVTLLATGKPL